MPRSLPDLLPSHFQGFTVRFQSLRRRKKDHQCNTSPKKEGQNGKKRQKIRLFWFLAGLKQRGICDRIFYLCDVCSTLKINWYLAPPLIGSQAEIFGFTQQQTHEVRCFAKCSVLFVISLVTCQEERVILSASKAPNNGHCKWSL